jgi:uncharacterized membrane protein
MTVGLIVHALAAMIWVGGMFFAYQVLRRAARTIDPHVRLELWGQVFGQFFPWVWLSIVALLASGYGMIFLGLGGFANAGVHVHLMQATGLLMMALFLHLYFAPWRRMRRALDQQDYPAASRQLTQIRWIVATNLALGLVTVAIGASGRYWG